MLLDENDEYVKATTQILLDDDIERFMEMTPNAVAMFKNMGKTDDQIKDLAWNAFHKARYEWVGIPRELREKSREWLEANGHDRLLGKAWPPKGVMPEEERMH